MAELALHSSFSPLSSQRRFPTVFSHVPFHVLLRQKHRINTLEMYRKNAVSYLGASFAVKSIPKWQCS